MHEFKHGELKSGPAAGKVKSRRQAIAIALKEAGASEYESERKNKRNLVKTARGETYQQEREGKSHVGARGRRESSRAMGGEDRKAATRREKARLKRFIWRLLTTSKTGHGVTITIEPTERARAGVTGHNARYVLSFGLIGSYSRFRNRICLLLSLNDVDPPNVIT